MRNRTKVYVGMDVHKDSVMIAVLPEGVREPTLVKRLSHDPRGLRRLLDRLSREHEVRACYEASGAGYVLERMIRSWGHACEIVAPSLIPRRPENSARELYACLDSASRSCYLSCTVRDSATWR